MVPTPAFDAAQGRSGSKSNKNLPVLVWIHGGGYVQGSKDGAGNPAGLVAESLRGGRDGIVYVQINYRLGLFGFPPRKIGQQDITSNAGLYDQLLALNWVQANIHLF